jgi:hypothetical protein
VNKVMTSASWRLRNRHSMLSGHRTSFARLGSGCIVACFERDGFVVLEDTLVLNSPMMMQVTPGTHE